jgi:hypothetical protein
VAQECLCSMERFLVSVNMKYLGTNAQRVTAFNRRSGFSPRRLSLVPLGRPCYSLALLSKLTSVLSRLLDSPLSSRKKAAIGQVLIIPMQRLRLRSSQMLGSIPSLVIGSAVRNRPSESWSTQSRYIIKSNANPLRYLTRRRSTQSSVRRA